MKIKNLKYWLAVISLLIVGAAGYKIYFQKPKVVQKRADIRITTVSPVLKSIKEKLTATGNTIPQEDVIVATELIGLRVTKIFADVGQSVKAGDILAELDSASLKNQLAQARSDYDRAIDDFERTDKLKNTGVISPATLQQKKSIMEVAKAKLAEAELNLKRAQVIAPVDGIIYERKADIGEQAIVNVPLFRLSQNGVIEFEAKIPEAQFSRLKKGMKALIHLTGNTKPLEGIVRIVTPAIDPVSRLVGVRVSLQTDQNLPVGLYGTAEIFLGDITGISLPVTALQQDPFGLFVWKINQDNKVERLAIEPIYRDMQYILVKDIAKDLKIIAKAGAFVKEGESVIVVEGK